MAEKQVPSYRQTEQASSDELHLHLVYKIQMLRKGNSLMVTIWCDWCVVVQRCVWPALWSRHFATSRRAGLWACKAHRPRRYMDCFRYDDACNVCGKYMVGMSQKLQIVEWFISWINVVSVSGHLCEWVGWVGWFIHAVLKSQSHFVWVQS